MSLKKRAPFEVIYSSASSGRLNGFASRQPFAANGGAEKSINSSWHGWRWLAMASDESNPDSFPERPFIKAGDEVASLVIRRKLS